MNVAILKVEVHKETEFLYRFSVDDSPQVGIFSAQLPPEKFILEHLPTEVVAELIPDDLWIVLKQWILDSTVPGVIAIESDDFRVHAFSWELIPAILEIPDVFVVRLQTPNKKRTDWSDELSILAVGWPTGQLPFINTELEMLAEFGKKTQITIDVLSSPSVPELIGRLGAKKPTILHMIPQHTFVNDEGVVLMTGHSDFVPVAKLAAAIDSEHAPHLTVINTCDSGLTRDGVSAASILSKITGCMAVGWLGTVEDSIAASFPAFLYRRMTEGVTVIHALQKFASLEAMTSHTNIASRGLIAASAQKARRQLQSVPVVWCPDVQTLELSFKLSAEDALEPPRRARRSGGSLSTTQEKRPQLLKHDLARISVKLQLRNVLNPALLKNGVTPIVSLSLDASNAVSNVDLEVSCDTGSRVSLVKQSVDLLSGLQPIEVESFQFPVLYELAERSSRRRLINFTVTCHIGNQLINQVTKSVLWMGLAEWLDRSDVWAYIPAFVLPNSDGILDVIDKADSVLKTIDSPKSAFDGYQSGDIEKVSKQIEAIFNTLRDAPFQLSYINPPASPIYEPGETRSSGQLVRFPDEVIERKRGTCHDLALFFAGCAEHIGICPLVILIQGHTFFGFWNDADKRSDFWEHIPDRRKEKNPLDNSFGQEWIITSKEELVSLVESGAVTLLESTKVTDRNARYSDAVEHGRENLNRLQEDEFDIAVDINSSRYTVQAI